MNFAIIETGGTQYRVEKGQVLELNRLNLEKESNVIFDKVLLVHDDKDTRIGTPFLEDVEVVGKVVEHKRGDKIVVFKMKPKKRYQKKQGHRQELTVVEITDIKVASKKVAKKPVEDKKEEVKEAPVKEKTPAKATKKASKPSVAKKVKSKVPTKKIASAKKLSSKAK